MKPQVVRIQKTAYVDGTAAELYEFWKNPQNYPKVFAHVKQITPGAEWNLLVAGFGPGWYPPQLEGKNHTSGAR